MISLGYDGILVSAISATTSPYDKDDIALISGIRFEIVVRRVDTCTATEVPYAC